MNRITIEAIGVVLLLFAFGWYSYSMENRGVEKQLKRDLVAADQQREAVATEAKAWARKLANEGDRHASEIADLAAHQPKPGVVRCYPAAPAAMPGPAGVPKGASATPGVVPGDAGLHPDIAPALRLLARRADRLAADARELDRLTH